MLAALAMLQWLLLAILVHRVVHNGWLFAQDREATYSYSTAWSFAHGHLPRALVGYGWPLVTAPIAGITGADFLDGLPAVVLLQTLLLLPIALAAVYGVASRILGRRLGYFTAAVWVLLPFVVHSLYASTYHPTYVQQLLPQGLGLTGVDDFPSMVCVLVAAYFVVVSIDTGDPGRAVVGGLFAGFAIAVDPANLLFLAAPAVGYLLARRWRPGALFGVALLPALVTVVLWQYRGVGHVPVHADIDLHHLERLRVDFRDVFYSDWLVEVSFVAGVIALGRRSWVKSAFVAVWFIAYVVVRGSAPGTNVADGTWFGQLVPAYPAFVIAICALPLLVPRVGARLARAATVDHPSRVNLHDRRIVACAFVLALLPIVVVAALPLQRGPRTVAYAPEHALVPVDAGFKAYASGYVGAAQVTWPTKKADGAASHYYVVFRSPANGTGGLVCNGSGVKACALSMQPLTPTFGVTYIDGIPAGKWTYRVGLLANPHNDPSAGGLMLLSPPIDVTVH